ncbi:hypothetical protein [Nocardioides sp. WS12]|uniref:hypothetical protein n=1 Tax=Nocardioides sp. WS12 TaxID=2486272 RepID=UPI0015FD140B|nr:hypothetical protein [Nocardioides sp. WS12]
MEPSRLAENMAAAWAARVRANAAEHAAITEAPALFKPERREQVEADFVRARAEVGRWPA